MKVSIEAKAEIDQDNADDLPLKQDTFLNIDFSKMDDGDIFVSIRDVHNCYSTDFAITPKQAKFLATALLNMV
jgi:hypothetical protein